MFEIEEARHAGDRTAAERLYPLGGRPDVRRRLEARPRAVDEGPGKQPEIGARHRGPSRLRPVDLAVALEGGLPQGDVDRDRLCVAGLRPGEVGAAGGSAGLLPRRADRGVPEEADLLLQSQGRAEQLSLGPADAAHGQSLDLPSRPGDDAAASAERAAGVDRPHRVLPRESPEDVKDDSPASERSKRTGGCTFLLIGLVLLVTVVV